MEYLMFDWPRNRKFPIAPRMKPEIAGAMKVIKRLGYLPKKDEMNGTLRAVPVS
jgi:hypothetical protein